MNDHFSGQINSDSSEYLAIVSTSDHHAYKQLELKRWVPIIDFWACFVYIYIWMYGKIYIF